jgi:hypothetical protein
MDLNRAIVVLDRSVMLVPAPEGIASVDEGFCEHRWRRAARLDQRGASANLPGGRCAATGAEKLLQQRF